MRKLLALLLFSLPIAAQQNIRVDQIRPSPNSGWIITTSGGVSVWAPAPTTTGFPITLGTTPIASGATVTSIVGLTIDGVTPATMAFVNPTSSIQGQFNLKAPLASPTFTGTVTLPITGSTQCLVVNSSGVISGAGIPCAGGTLTGQVAGYAIEAATSTTATGPFPLDDAITTANTITAHKAFAINDASGNAGAIDLPQGAAPGAAPANNVQIQTPTSVTAYRLQLPGAQPSAANQFLTCTNADPSVCSFATPTGSGTTTIASGTSALGTSAISSAACATVVTTTATGVASTDAIIWNTNASIKAVTGYTPATTGGLTINVYPTTNAINTDVCNWTASSITPGAVTLNWRVVR